MATDSAPRSGHAHDSRRQDLPARLVAAGLEILSQHGPAELTLRRIADVAGTSTMAVYTRFGGRAEMLDAIYRQGFVVLVAALDGVPEVADPAQRVLDLGLAYRRFALAHPALYGFLFERPLPDFDPTPEARREALNMAFTPLIDAVSRLGEADSLPRRKPERAAYLVWTTLHGIVSIELTCTGRTPLPGWFLDTPEVGEQVLIEGVRAMLAGLEASGE